MLADECRLHAALCAELTTEAVDEDLQAVQQLWAGVRLPAFNILRNVRMCCGLFLQTH